MTVDFSCKAYLDKVDAWWRAANYGWLLKCIWKTTHCWNMKWLKTTWRTPIGHFGGYYWTKPCYHTHLNRTINKYGFGCSTLKDSQVMVDSNGVNSYLDVHIQNWIQISHKNEEGFKHLCGNLLIPRRELSHRGTWNSRIYPRRIGEQLCSTQLELFWIIQMVLQP